MNDVVASVRAYAKLAPTDPAGLVGVTPLLLRMGMTTGVAKACSVVTALLGLGLAALCGRRLAAPGGTAHPATLMIGFASVGWAQPIQDYDVAIFVPVLAFAALLSRRRQLALLVPLLVLWRPKLLRLLPGVAASGFHNVGMSIAWACVTGLLLYWVARDTRFGRVTLSPESGRSEGHRGRVRPRPRRE